MHGIIKIVSGGQTGADRAALDTAIALNIPHGGWCPKSRLAEDGTIDQAYNLIETPSSDYNQRTLWNVRDADGTIIFFNSKPIGGTLFTIDAANEFSKPYLLIDLDFSQSITVIYDWILENKIRILNIAGSRESQQPGIYKQVFFLLSKIFD